MDAVINFSVCLSLTEKKTYKKLALVISSIALAITVLVLTAPIHIFTQYTVIIEILEIGTSLDALFCLLKSNNQSKAAIAVGLGMLI
ncbi:MAG: hypothetical protein KBI01_00020 [Oscillospiraceae bacterium]|nr:hypothetical protein [Oscillospiraceae bacterium]